MSKIVIRDVRLSFPDLFQAVQYQGQGPFQYRASFLMPKDHASKAMIDKTIAQVALDKWGAKAEKLLPQILATSNKCCFADGDAKAYNGYAGNWALTSTRNEETGAPVVVDRDKSPLSHSSGKIYSGCYVNATVDLWAQDNSFGRAIRATLVNVQFVRNGESLGGAAPASADDLEELAFEDEEDLI